MLAPKVELQLYEGALEGSLGISIGPSVSTTISFTKDEETCDILDSIDVNFGVSASVSLGTKFSESLEFSKKLFDFSTPITSIDIGENKCPNRGPCGDDFLDELAAEFSEVFNSAVFLSQNPDPTIPPSPSTVYKFQDFVKAIENLQKVGKVRCSKLLTVYLS